MVEFTILAHHRGRLDNGGWVHPINQELHLNRNSSGCENCYRIDALKRDGLQSYLSFSLSVIATPLLNVQEPICRR